jgi:hypothetical protein
MQVACHISLESFQRMLQLWFRLDINQRVSKGAGVSILGISRLPIGSPETKRHLGAGPMAKHRVYYKGEGGGFPQVQAVVNLVSPCLPVAHSRTKSALAMH